MRGLPLFLPAAGNLFFSSVLFDVKARACFVVHRTDPDWASRGLISLIRCSHCIRQGTTTWFGAK